MLESRSPWSSLKGINSVNITPFRKPIQGKLAITGSKSYTNRALIIAGAASGTSHLTDILKSDDSYWCISSLRQLGVIIEEDFNTITITGTSAKWTYPKEPIFIGSAGTSGRFLTSLLALTAKYNININASEQLSQRPMNTIFTALTQLGSDIHFSGKPGHFPVTLLPKKKGSNSIAITGAISSQFISGLLIATPYLDHEVEIHVRDNIVQSDYVNVTLDVMHAFGVDVEKSENLDYFKVCPGVYKAVDYQIEADASTASYFMALAAVTGGKILLTNLNYNTSQPDIQFLGILEQLGCSIKQSKSGITILGPEKLKGGLTIDMNACSDTALTLAAIAPFASGPIEIEGVAHIRTHESDRISVIADSLKKVNVPVEEKKGGLVIYPARPTHARLNTHDDHRVAMALSVLGIAGSGIELDDPGCVSKTCPSFFQQLEDLGIQVKYN